MQLKIRIVKAASHMESFLLFGHNIKRTLKKNNTDPFIDYIFLRFQSNKANFLHSNISISSVSCSSKTYLPLYPAVVPMALLSLATYTVFSSPHKEIIRVIPA